jgi:hypothetical protein
MFSFPLLLTIYAGFTHAFEADHLLAVSNLVSRRNNTMLSMKDGIFWGLGHSSTIFFIGVLMILFKVGISEHHEHHGTQHKHLHVHIGKEQKHSHTHSLAYGVGLVHGLAGSGALILIVMSQIKSPVDGLIYLVIFSAGCIVGMLVAAGLFSIPFSKKMMQARILQSFLILTSSVLCLLYGSKVIYENLVL